MLHRLARSGDVAGLRQHLIKKDARSVNSLNNEGETPLLCANYSKPEIVRLLLQHGAKVNVLDSNQLSPLHLAVVSKCVESVRLILEADKDNVNLNLVDEDEMTALSVAVEESMLPIAKLLLKAGADPNVKNGGQTVLYSAVEKGDESMVYLLLDHGADPVKANKIGNTALFEAVQHENTDITRRFLELGANVNQSNVMRRTLLYHAVQEGQLEQIKLLVKKGADLSAVDVYGHNVLHIAAKTGLANPRKRVRIIEYLLEKDVDPDKPDNGGITPLLFAMRYAHLESVQCFVGAADFQAKDRNNQTALHYAAKNEKSVKVLWFLLNLYGFTSNLEDRTQEGGYTALHGAAWAGLDEHCALLLKHGANINAKSDKGRSPLYYASIVPINEFNMIMDFNKSSTIELLLRHGADATTESILSVIVNTKIYEEDDDDHWEKACVVLRHLAKIECFGDGSQGAIGAEDRKSIERSKKSREYFKACIAELKRLKVRKIFEDVSLLDIWTESESVIVGYAKNQKLVQGFMDENDEEEFPIFADILAKRFEKHIEKPPRFGAVMELDENFCMSVRIIKL